MLPFESYEINKIIVYTEGGKFTYKLNQTYVGVGEVVELRFDTRTFYEHGLYHIDIYVVNEDGEHRAWKTIVRQSSGIDIQYNKNK